MEPVVLIMLAGFSVFLLAIVWWGFVNGVVRIIRALKGTEDEDSDLG